MTVSAPHPTLAECPEGAERVQRRLGWVATGMAGVGGLTGVAGFLFSIGAPAEADVRLGAALGFVLASVGLTAAVHRSRMVALGCAVGLVALAAPGGRLPVSPNASLSLALLAVALGALTWMPAPRRWPIIAGASGLAVCALCMTKVAITAVDVGEMAGWSVYSGVALYNASLLSLLGMGTVAAAMRSGSAAGIPVRRWLAALSAAGIAVVTIVLWQTSVDHNRAGARRAVRAQADAMAGELSRRSTDRTLLLERLATRWANERPPSPVAWSASTREWLRDYPGMRDLAWADLSTTQRWSAPDGVSGLVGLGERLDADPRTADALRRAALRRATQATAPVQIGDAPAITLLVAPVMRDGRVTGYLSSRLDLSRFLHDVFGEDVVRGYAFSVRDGDAVLVRRNRRRSAPADQWQQSLPLTAMGRRWVLTVVPTEEMLALASSSVPTAVLVCGLLLALVVGWIVLVAQRSREMTGQLAILVEELARENAARRDSEQMRAALVHSTLDGVAAFDASGCVSAWNPRMAALTGRAESEVDGQMIGEMVAFLPRGAEVSLLLDALAGQGTQLPDVCTTEACTGAEIWLDITVTPMRSAGGMTLGGLLVARDVTERKRLADVVLAGKLAAEEANRAKSDFLARMSHELRTPLNAVIGFTNVLCRNRHGRLERDEMTYLERIGANGRHLLGLINEVLDLAKIESGRESADFAPVALGTLVRDTLAELDVRASGASVRLQAQLPAGHLELRTDEAKLKQVLINLIGNAIKFTPAAGRVTVTVTTEEGTGRPTRIDVADTGIGIPPERLAAIFEAFEQVDSDTARRFGGTGLGLAISRKLCHLMGHDLVVHSEVGVGSTFSITLRQAAEEQAAA